VGSGQELPEIGHGRRNDQGGRSLRWLHHQSEQPHGNGRQAHTGKAFDGAGQNEADRDAEHLMASWWHAANMARPREGGNSAIWYCGFVIAEGWQASHMRFEFVDLQLFLCIAETASITHGAKRAHMALASASARVSKLEALAGVELLERGRRGVTLTPAGRALAHHAMLVLGQLEHLKGELSEFAGGLKGQVRLQANTAALSEFLPGVLSEFLLGNPRVDVDVEERSSYAIVRAVATGFAEIGIAADIVDFGNLEVLPFAVDQLVVIVPRRHRLAPRRSLSFRELLDEEFVGLAPTNALQQYLGQHALQAGKPLNLRVRLSSFEAVCRMVGSGIAVAIVPATAARRCQKAAAIRIARLTDPWSLRRLHVCVRRTSELRPPARQLVEHFRLRCA
jgi:DNA-binding transcriptional LysR family regulator